MSRSRVTIHIWVEVVYSFFKKYFGKRVSEQGRGRERARQEILNGLCADNREPDVGLELKNCEIMISHKLSHPGILAVDS